jgi:SAM-dependent methyltransferase
MTDIKAVHKYTDAWNWPDDVQRFVREQLPDGRVLNVPCGGCRIGDVLVDAEPQSAEVQQGDMMDLDFPNCSFDAVISDPPWKELNYFDRWQQFFECVRVTKPNGLIIYNATWEPYSDQVQVEGRYRRADGAFRQVSQITVFRRYPDQLTLSESYD